MCGFEIEMGIVLLNQPNISRQTKYFKTNEMFLERWCRTNESRFFRSNFKKTIVFTERNIFSN